MFGDSPFTVVGQKVCNTLPLQACEHLGQLRAKSEKSSLTLTKLNLTKFYLMYDVMPNRPVLLCRLDIPTATAILSLK